MQWDASIHAGFSTVEPWLPVSSYYTSRNVEIQLADPTSILNLYRKLFTLHSGSRALFGGAYQPIETDCDHCFVFLRQSEEEKRLVLLNFSDRTQQLNVFKGSGLILLSTHLDRQEEISLENATLRPHEGVIVVL